MRNMRLYPLAFEQCWVLLVYQDYNNSYCIFCGRIKDKNSIVSAIKYQVCCIETTALWVTNTVQLCCIISLQLTSPLLSFPMHNTWILITSYMDIQNLLLH